MIKNIKLNYLNILMFATFLFGLAVGTISFGLVFFVTDLFHVGNTEIGLINSGQTICYLIGIIIFSVSKNTHPRYHIGLSTLSMAIFIAFYTLIKSWNVTLIFHSLYGFGMALFWPRISGWISWGLEGEDLSRTMSQYNLSWSVGGIIAPVLGGFLTEINVVYPIIFAAVVLAIIGFGLPLASKIFPEMKKGQEEIKQARLLAQKVGEEPVELDNNHSEKTFLRFPAWFGVVSTYITTSFILYIFPTHLRDTLGYREAIIGIFLFCRQLFASVGFTIWGRFKFWHFKSSLIWINQLITILLVVLLIRAESSIVLAVILAIYGVNYSLTYVMGQFYVVTGSTNRERSMTIHEAACDVGNILGVFFGGFLSDLGGVGFTFRTFTIVAIVVLIGQTIMIVYEKRHRKVISKVVEPIPA